LIGPLERGTAADPRGGVRSSNAEAAPLAALEPEPPAEELLALIRTMADRKLTAMLSTAAARGGQGQAQALEQCFGGSALLALGVVVEEIVRGETQLWAADEARSRSPTGNSRSRGYMATDLTESDLRAAVHLQLQGGDLDARDGGNGYAPSPVTTSALVGRLEALFGAALQSVPNHTDVVEGCLRDAEKARERELGAARRARDALEARLLHPADEFGPQWGYERTGLMRKVATERSLQNCPTDWKGRAGERDTERKNDGKRRTSRPKVNPDHEVLSARQRTLPFYISEALSKYHSKRRCDFLVANNASKKDGIKGSS
jgi:hypothetical protein